MKIQNPTDPLDSSDFISVVMNQYISIDTQIEFIQTQENPSTYDVSVCTNTVNVLSESSKMSACPWDEKDCSAAARSGFIPILYWLRSQDLPCPWSEKTCAAAAQGKNLKAPKLLLAQDPPCTWDKETCEKADACLRATKWLKIRILLVCCMAAIRIGRLVVLKWLIEQEPPCPWENDACFAEARRNSNMASWIQQQHR